MRSHRFLTLALAAVIGVAFLGAALADDKPVTVSGTIQCAKCALKKEGYTKCQDVLIADGKEYYLVKNEAVEKFGHTCKGEKAAVVTGKVEEKEGKTWLTPTKIEPAKT